MTLSPLDVKVETPTPTEINQFAANSNESLRIQAVSTALSQALGALSEEPTDPAAPRQLSFTADWASPNRQQTISQEERERIRQEERERIRQEERDNVP